MKKVLYEFLMKRYVASGKRDYKLLKHQNPKSAFKFLEDDCNG